MEAAIPFITNVTIIVGIAATVFVSGGTSAVLLYRFKCVENLVLGNGRVGIMERLSQLEGEVVETRRQIEHIPCSRLKTRRDGDSPSLTDEWIRQKRMCRDD